MSTKRPYASGKNFYIYDDCINEEKGVTIKFNCPDEINILSLKGNIKEVEVCISKENWKDFLSKVKKIEDEG